MDSEWSNVLTERENKNDVSKSDGCIPHYYGSIQHNSSEQIQKSIKYTHQDTLSEKMQTTSQGFQKTSEKMYRLHSLWS